MDWQLVTVAALVALSLAYLARGAWRMWAARGCASACGGCKPAAGPKPTVVLVERLTVRCR